MVHTLTTTTSTTTHFPLCRSVNRRCRALRNGRGELADGMLAAMRAHKADHHMEGVYWLVHVLGPVFAAPSSFIHSSSTFEH